MQFRINPECYHKMCSSCIDRIFSAGPALCPIAGCGKTLRKAKFRAQTFSDIAVEREVDIRKKLAAVFNSREEDFETAADYNQYLEDVETMTFDVIGGGPEVDSTWAKIRAYENANADKIAINADLAAADLLSAEERQFARKEAARQRREIARRQEDADRTEREEIRTELIDQLAMGKDAVKLAERQRVKLKKSSAARKGAVDDTDNLTRAATGGVLEFSGLRRTHLSKVHEMEVKPYSPFQGGRPTFGYHIVQSSYENPYMDMVTKQENIIAGGYDLKEYFRETVCEALGGFGVFL
ncbi:MAG: TFIIH/NER complex subunit [Vezdaea aestivalis]|nr:MAG: TFIIH/NER complex subunit [Vezdaea aestivalis]